MFVEHGDVPYEPYGIPTECRGLHASPPVITPARGDTTFEWRWLDSPEPSNVTITFGSVRNCQKMRESEYRTFARVAASGLYRKWSWEVPEENLETHRKLIVAPRKKRIQVSPEEYVLLLIPQGAWRVDGTFLGAQYPPNMVPD